MFDLQPLLTHLITQRSDVPAEQPGPNTLSSAQVSQAAPPKPSCGTPRQTRETRRSVFPEALGFLTDAPVNTRFSTVSSFSPFLKLLSISALILCWFYVLRRTLIPASFSTKSLERFQRELLGQSEGNRGKCLTASSLVSLQSEMKTLTVLHFFSFLFFGLFIYF